MDAPASSLAPAPSAKMPSGIPYIVGNEAAERFSFYGMRAILVVFMTKYLRDRHGSLAPMSDNEADGWYHLFIATNYFFPIFGAILADALWGKYRTIFWLSIVYCFGHFSLALDDTRLGLALGLGLISIGSGGIKPCVSANVGDQFTAANQHLISRAFGWFYFSINAGSFISILLIPWLLDAYNSKVAFAVPGVLMAIATLIFWLGRRRFIHVPPSGIRFVKETLFSREALATLGRLGVIYVFVALGFWTMWDQSGGEWVLQAERMNLKFLGFNLLSSQIQSVNAVMILAFIPLFQYVVYPAIDKVFPLTPLRKIGLGFVVTGSSFLISAWIETRLAAGAKPSIAWQIPAYALLTAGEIMVSITSLEFSYTQAPKAMKSVVMAIYLWSISAGNLFAALVHKVIENPDGTAKLSGARYYLFYFGLSVVSAFVFVFFARRYKEQNYLQDEFPANTPTSEAAPVS
ncbi:MAG TPA: POT family MFS transporter [Opitutaceae bacterium]|jgi:POT family proton-dependent oligopeptide transporter